MSKINQQVRQALIKSVGSRYRRVTRPEKKLILDEFVRITGYHRKHAIRLLRGGGGDPMTPVRRQKKRVYDEAVSRCQ